MPFGTAIDKWKQRQLMLQPDPAIPLKPAWSPGFDPSKQQDIPWWAGGAGGKPQPKQPRPAFGNPMQMPGQQMQVPGFEMPPVDPSMAAYANSPVQLGGQQPQPQQRTGMMGFGDALKGLDVSQAAYPGYGKVERQPQPGEQSTGQSTDAQGGDGFLGMDGMDWISMGMGLLSGAQNGGDWSVPLQTFQGIQRENKEDKRYSDAQKRQAEQDAMQKQLFEQQLAEGKYTQEQRTRLGEQQQALAASLQQTNPDLANAIKSMSTEQFGQFYGNKLLADEQTKAEGIRLKAQQDFQRELTGMEIGARASEGAKDRAASLEAAKLRNPNETAQGRADLALLAPWQEAAGIAQTYTLSRVEKMKDIIQKLAKMNGLQGPIDANTKASLAGWGAASPEAAALYQEYRNLMGQFTREEAQKVKPVSNIDMDAIEKQMASPDMQLQASMNILDRIDREARAGIQRTNDMVRWHDSGKSFADVDPKTGKTIYETLGMTSSGLAGPAALPASNGSSAAPPAVGATMRGPDGKDYIYVGGDPNDKKKLAGQIVEIHAVCDPVQERLSIHPWRVANDQVPMGA